MSMMRLLCRRWVSIRFATRPSVASRNNITFLQLTCASCDLIFCACREFTEWNIVLLASIARSQGYLPGIHFIFTYDQHIRYFHQLRTADLGVHALGAQVRADTD